MEDFRFKVNLRGMIEILSDHLYSSPDVYIRELLQNAVDAVTGLKKWNEQTGKESIYEGNVTLEIEENKSLIFSDNGQGLTEDEIHQFLAIIGESSKRDIAHGMVEEDYIGRFGIGLLSCFMVADGITMLTKSCKQPNAPVLQWCGKPDGTYTIEHVEEEQFLEESGTKVILHAKAGMEQYFTRECLEKLVIHYGMLLHIPITIRQDGESKQINPTYLPWEEHTANGQELMIFGQMMFGEQFFDCIPFQFEEGGISGVIYIVNYSRLPSAKTEHKIYLKNMLLTEKGDNLIPDWAVFTRCLVNVMSLRPTASREGFYVDEDLAKARERIEDVICNYIIELAQKEPNRFHQFFSIHNLTLRSIALRSEKLFETLIDYLEFETTRGILTGYDLKNGGEDLIYAPTEEKYKQLSQLFFARDKLLINVTYVYSLELLECLGELYEINVCAVEEWEIEDLMRDLSPEDADTGFEFLENANQILKKYDCQAELKYFAPYHQPTFYLIDENTLFQRQIAASREQASSMFFNMLDAFATEYSNKMAATLFFNYNSPVVKKIVQLEETELQKIIVEILYVQALQVGGFALHNNEMSLLNRNILALIERGIS
ncbi:MAG: HSP90 family protein [Lachnospiraceae bacterium]|nr:HSP90 family protein [Lachnospiraceae bacterium]